MDENERDFIIPVHLEDLELVKSDRYFVCQVEDFNDADNEEIQAAIERKLVGQCFEIEFNCVCRNNTRLGG